jgi:hypothetical protein
MPWPRCSICYGVTIASRVLQYMYNTCTSNAPHPVSILPSNPRSTEPASNSLALALSASDFDHIVENQPVPKRTKHAKLEIFLIFSSMQALRRVSCSARPLAASLRSTSGSTTTLATHRLAPASSSIIASSFSTSSSSLSAATVTHDHGHGHGHGVGSTAKASSGVTSGDSIIPLSNIQAQWESMTEEERSLVHEQLEELQTRDWRSMSLDEKRAGLYTFPFSFYFTIVPLKGWGGP